ncbi:MAG: hypothetical protein WCW04_02775 [Candidatus Paceibacterota bacterium]
MFEKFQSGAETKKEEVSLKDKALRVIKDATQIATLLSLFSVPINEASAADLKEKSPSNSKNKIELAQDVIKKINVVLEEKCKGTTHTLGNQDIRSYKLTKGTEVASANNGDWFILMDKDGANTFLDENQDGSVDRFIINNQVKEYKKGLLLNAMYAFGDMEFHAKSGQITSGTPMEEDVKISSFDLKNKRIYCVDMKSGKSGIIEGEAAEKFFEKVQAAYTSQLESVANGENRNESDSSLSELLSQKEQTPEAPKSSPVSGKPEKQPEYVKPTLENTANFMAESKKQFDDYKKSQQSSFDAFKKASEDKFNQFRNNQKNK